MSSIVMTHVKKFYGKVQVIKDFSYEFKDKEFITLLGPSGCGKTTLLRMIAGFEKPSEGEIRIDDVIVSGPENFVPPNERHIGMVFQSYAVWPHMNVFDNVAYPLKISRVPKKEIQERVMDILEAVDLSNLENRMPDELSGGQQQRVALGRALVSKPKVLLLDEPLSNLDTKLRESMRYEIKNMQKKFGITVIYVTHDQIEAMTMSDKIILFNGGVAQQIGTPITIYNNPVNKFVADFIGRINILEGISDGQGLIKFSESQAINYSGDKRGPVTVAVRPENIKINKDKGILPGTISQIYYLGEFCECYVKVEGQKSLLLVFVPGAELGELQVNEKVWIDFKSYLVFQDD